MLKKLTALHNKNRGDTIVEVMIVLAVLGLAIGISYTTANRSLLNARQAQENSEATELVQSQAQQLSTLASITDPADPNYIYKSGLFCLTTTSGAAQVISGFSGIDPLDYNSYPVSPTPCVNSYYHLSISCRLSFSSPPTACSNSHNDPNVTFTIEAVWDDVLGNGQDTVTLVYKVHP